MNLNYTAVPKTNFRSGEDANYANERELFRGHRLFGRAVLRRGPDFRVLLKTGSNPEIYFGDHSNLILTPIFPHSFMLRGGGITLQTRADETGKNLSFDNLLDGVDCRTGRPCHF